MAGQDQAINSLSEPVLVTVAMTVAVPLPVIIVSGDSKSSQHLKGLNCSPRTVHVILLRTATLRGSNPVVVEARGLCMFICRAQVWLREGLLDIMLSRVKMNTEIHGLSFFHVSEAIRTVSRLIKNQNILLIKEYLKHGIINIKQIDISPLNFGRFLHNLLEGLFLLTLT